MPLYAYPHTDQSKDISLIHIELFGSWGARHVTSGTTIDFHNRKDPKSPIGPLCRELIKRGLDPDDHVHITRDGMSVFARDRKLQKWADYDVKDTQTSLRTRRHRPFGGAGRGLSGSELSDD